MYLLLIGPFPPPITGNSVINEKIKNNFHKYYNDINTDFIDIGIKNFSSDFGKVSIRKIYKYILQYKGIYKIFKSDKVYITIGHTFFGILKYLPFFLTAKLLNKPIIIHVHTDNIWRLYSQQNKVKKYILKAILSMSDKGIVLSSLLQRNLTPFLEKEKIYTLPNFISNSLLDHNIQKTIIAKKYEKIRILFLSNLMKEKGIIEFFEAMKILKDNHFAFEAHIAGDVPLDMRRTIDHYMKDLEEYAFYHGIVKDEEKRKLFLSTNIFVFPTHQEAQPLVLLEAMATGNIILSTNVGGIPDILKEPKNAFYINVNDPQQIAEKIMEIEKNYSHYNEMLKHNYYEVKSKYIEKIFFDNLYNILKD